jgi:hypothetical protein
VRELLWNSIVIATHHMLGHKKIPKNRERGLPGNFWLPLQELLR